MVVQILTNGIYRSVEHRVIVNKNSERMSIASFCNPSGDKKVGPMKELINNCNPPLYRSMTFNEYRKFIRRDGTRGKVYINSITSCEQIQMKCNQTQMKEV